MEKRKYYSEKLIRDFYKIKNKPRRNHFDIAHLKV